MDWSQFFGDLYLMGLGATVLKVGQIIDHRQKTWKCPHCPAPTRFSVTAPDKAAREWGRDYHLETSHPEVAEKTSP